ncbi:hypothetical protein FOZ63_027064 [Perkinsus olseni]|uniref:short-chain 2-methylacyl-CoA dehydrogenase n=1 Tax=Perkinsus olseni TaxID=32597 RepID=A0A7J6UJQ8_PEROL|nr:hypothetical protein FOZ63_027064 [Perkinsus olseni]
MLVPRRMLPLRAGSGLARLQHPCRIRKIRYFCSTASRLPLTMFTEDQELLRSTVRTFANDVIGPLVSKMDEKSCMDDSLVQALFDNGFMGMEIEASRGGSELGFVEALIAIEEISRVDPAVGAMIDIHNTLIPRSIHLYGNDDQKDTWLPRLAQDTVGAFAISEAGAGSDAFALKTTATKVPGGWTINGDKLWISNSREAGLFLLFATVDRSLGHKGITAFLLPKYEDGAGGSVREGFTIGPPEKKLGIKASSTCPLNFDNVFLPDTSLLGEVGEGYKVAMSLLNEGRIGIAAQMLGIAKAAIGHSIRYMTERKQFDRSLLDFQGIRFQLAELQAEIYAAHLLVYNAAALKIMVDRGELASKDIILECSAAKLKASRVAEEAASKGIEWLGGVGYTKDYPLEKLYRDAKIGQIYEGTSNIQLETIAKEIIKRRKNEVSSSSSTFFAMSAVVTGCIIGSFPLDSTPQLLRYHTDHIPKPIPHDTFDTVVAAATLQDDKMIGNEDEGASSSTSGIEAMVSGLGEALAKEAEFYSDRLSSVKLSVSASMIPSQLTSKGTLRRTAMRMLVLRYLNHPTAPAVTIGLLPSSTSPSTCYVGEGGALLTSRLSNIELLSLGVKPGEKLTGEVTHVSGTSIGVTVLGTWPATIPSSNMLSDWTYDEGAATWKRQAPAAVVKKGTRVTFFVDSVVTGSGSAAAPNDYDDDSYDWDASQTGGNRECYGVGGVEEDDVDATFTRKWAAATKAIDTDPNATSFRSLVTSKEIRDTTTVISAESTFTIIGALLEPAGAGAVSAKGKTAELEKVEDGEEDEGQKKVTKKRKHHHHHHEEEEAEVSPKASKTVKIEKKHKKHRKLSH